VILATPPTLIPVNETFNGLAPDGTMLVLGVGPAKSRCTSRPDHAPADYGSPSGSRHELRDALDFASRRASRPIHALPLESANELSADTREAGSHHAPCW